MFCVFVGEEGKRGEDSNGGRDATDRKNQLVRVHRSATTRTRGFAVFAGGSAQ
ncbi:hypothetical protein A2U01_0089877 [Trifolium medium]|uniref:Uncharacterized protein n=1 Tax=Trifolium medium TaxID=97028 RepID=A0A392U8A4_9FABA|nr:hypothetical protein [Trifolium medium]